MASSESQPGGSEEPVVSVIIKNPPNASVVDFKTAVYASWSVGDLKARICQAGGCHSHSGGRQIKIQWTII